MSTIHGNDINSFPFDVQVVILLMILFGTAGEIEDTMTVMTVQMGF